MLLSPAILARLAPITAMKSETREATEILTTGRVLRGVLTGSTPMSSVSIDYVAKVFNARAANPALWRGTVSRDQRNNGLEVITKTDAETGNKVVVIFSQTNQTVSIGGTGEDLINGGTVNGSVNVSAWVPAFIRMQ